MHLSTLERASLGRLDQGELPMLARASLGRLRNGQGIPGGDDAPHVGRSGKSRRWIRYHFENVEDEIKAAVRALQRLEERPTKANAKKAATAIKKIDTQDVSEPIVDASLRGTAFAVESEEFVKAYRQLRFVLEQIEKFRLREKQQEEAVIVLLLNL